MNDMLQRLSRRLTMDDIEMLCRQAMTDEQAFGELFALAFNPDKRTADNAAWTMTHLPRKADKWLAARQQTLIDEAMSVKGATRRRLLLTLLLRTPFEADQLRSDFLDFCLNGMLDDTQPTGVRAICTKLAFNQCRHYPELLCELQATLGMLDPKLLSPGLRSAFKKVAFVAQKNSPSRDIS